eukprot:4476996-Amphidinium_carterae.1
MAVAQGVQFSRAPTNPSRLALREKTVSAVETSRGQSEEEEEEEAEEEEEEEEEEGLRHERHPKEWSPVTKTTAQTKAVH